MTMTVDSLVYCGEHITGWRYLPDELVAVGARAGIDRHVIAAPKPRGYHLRPENERIAALVAQDRARFDGLVRVDPLQGEDAVAEAETFIARRHLAGILLHPGEEAFQVDDPRVDAVVAVADRHRVPVVVVAGIPWHSEALQVAALAMRHPRTTFVLTNGGQVNISGLGMQDAWSALEAAPNLVIQTSGEYRQDFLEDVVVRLGAERVLFASGAPQFAPAFEVLRARWADLPPDAIEAVLGSNWQRLLAARQG